MNMEKNIQFEYSNNHPYTYNKNQSVSQQVQAKLILTHHKKLTNMVPHSETIINLPNPCSENIVQQPRQRNDNCKKLQWLFSFILAIVPFIDKLTDIGFFSGDVKKSQSTNRYYIIQIVSWSLVCTLGLCLACRWSRRLKYSCFIASATLLNGSSFLVLLISGGCPFLCDRPHDQQLQKNYQKFQFKYSIFALFCDDSLNLAYQFLVIRDQGGGSAEEILVICVTLINILLFFVKMVLKCKRDKNRVANLEAQPPQMADLKNQQVFDLNTLEKYYGGNKNSNNQLPPIVHIQPKVNQNQKEPAPKNTKNQSKKKQKKMEQKNKQKQKKEERQEAPSLTQFISYTPYQTGMYAMNGQQYRATTNTYFPNDIFRVQGQMQANQARPRGYMTARAVEQRQYDRSMRGMGLF